MAVEWVTETPLHRAAFEGSTSKVVQLLDQGADIHATVAIILERSNAEGVTPMHIAALNPNPAIASLLIDRGAPIDGGDAKGNTPLHWAVTFAVQAVAELLLDQGADIEAKSDGDVTPLHLAVAGNVSRGLPDQAMVRLLLDRGADINGGSGGRLGTALHLAVQVENRLGLQLLLEKGADIGAIDGDGLTPCEKATQSGYLGGDSLLSLLCAGSSTSIPVPSENPTAPPTPPEAPSASSFSWVQDGLTNIERQALGHLQTIENQQPIIAKVVLGFAWIADDITDDERLALSYFEIIGGLLQSNFGNNDGTVQDIQARLEVTWLSDGINGAELNLLAQVSAIQEPSTLLAVIFTLQPP